VKRTFKCLANRDGDVVAGCARTMEPEWRVVVDRVAQVWNAGGPARTGLDNESLRPLPLSMSTA
jgi:hypothetical protein